MPWMLTDDHARGVVAPYLLPEEGYVPCVAALPVATGWSFTKRAALPGVSVLARWQRFLNLEGRNCLLALTPSRLLWVRLSPFYRPMSVEAIDLAAITSTKVFDVMLTTEIWLGVAGQNWPYAAQAAGWGSTFPHQSEHLARIAAQLKTIGGSRLS